MHPFESLGLRSSFAAGVLAAVIAAPSSAQFAEPDVRILHDLRGEVPGDQFGWVTANIGDITGDGIADFTVGAPGHDTGASNGGRVYVYDGFSAALLFTHDGTVSQGRLGHRVSKGGDVNGDGVPDYTAGAPGRRVNGVTGTAFVYSGADHSILHQFTGEAARDRLGHDVSIIKDLNGDGRDDILIGATHHDAGQQDSGRVYVHSGLDGSLIRTHDGVKAGAQFGASAGDLGDLNGDSISDYGVGASGDGFTGSGIVYVFSGSDGALLYTLNPTSPTANGFGDFFVFTPGDVTGDGVGDIYTCDFADTGNGANTGYAYMFNGATGALLWAVPGTSAGGFFGIGRNAGDVDDDGFPDLILGNISDPSSAPSGGSATIFSGDDGSVVRTMTGNVTGGQQGADEVVLDDIDGDTLADMIVTTVAFSGSRGRTFVIAGVDHMKLKATPDAPVAGDTVSIQGHGGRAGGPMLLAVTAINGTPTFASLFSSVFDPQGKFQLSGAVPGGLAGNTITLQHFGISRIGQPTRSTPEEVDFQ